MALVPDPAITFIETFVDTWVHAEQRGDVTLLSELLDDDFVGVDDGDTLDKERWLARYRSGGLVHHAFCWRTIDANVRERGAFVVGRARPLEQLRRSRRVGAADGDAHRDPRSGANRDACRLALADHRPAHQLRAPLDATTASRTSGARTARR